MEKMESASFSISKQFTYRIPNYSDEETLRKTKDSGISGSSESTPNRSNEHQPASRNLNIDLRLPLSVPKESPSEDDDEEGKESNSLLARYRRLKKRKLYRKSRRKSVHPSPHSSDEEKVPPPRISASLPATPSLYRLLEGAPKAPGRTNHSSGVRRSLSQGVLIPTISPRLEIDNPEKNTLIKKATKKKKKKKKGLPKTTTSEQPPSSPSIKTFALKRLPTFNISSKSKEVTSRAKVAKKKKKKKPKSDTNQITPKTVPSTKDDHSKVEDPVEIQQNNASSDQEAVCNDNEDDDIVPPDVSQRRNSRPEFAKSYILPRKISVEEEISKGVKETRKSSIKYSMLNSSIDYDTGLKTIHSNEKNSSSKSSGKLSKMKNIETERTRRGSKLFRASPHVTAAKNMLLRDKRNSRNLCKGPGSLRDYSEFVKRGGVVPQKILDPEKGVEFEVYASMMDSERQREEEEAKRVMNSIFQERDVESQDGLLFDDNYIPSIEDATLSSQIAYITQKISDHLPVSQNEDLPVWNYKPSEIKSEDYFPSSVTRSVETPAVNSIAGGPVSSVTTAESGYGSRVMTDESLLPLPLISGSVTPSVTLEWSTNEHTMTHTSPTDIMFNSGITEEALEDLKKRRKSSLCQLETKKSESPPPSIEQAGLELLDSMFGLKDSSGESINPKPPIVSSEPRPSTDLSYMTGLTSLDMFIDPLEIFGSDRHPVLKKVLAQMKKSKEEKAKILDVERKKAVEQYEEERRIAAEKLEEERRKAAERIAVQETLIRLKNQRRNAELQRESLLNKAKELRTRAQAHKEKLAVLWIEKLKEEKEKTGPLEEVCEALRDELDAEHRRRMEAFDIKMKPIIIRDGPSRKANFKIAAAKLHYEIYELTIRIRHATLRVEQEEQIREICEAEVKRLREEISDKKLAITTVTKGIPFSKIEVRPEVQKPQVTDPYVLLQSYHKFQPLSTSAATGGGGSLGRNAVTSSRSAAYKNLSSVHHPGRPSYSTSDNEKHRLKKLTESSIS